MTTSDMASRLRHSHEYIRTHRVFDHGVMLEAATYIERLEEELAGFRADAQAREAEDRAGRYEVVTGEDWQAAQAVEVISGYHTRDEAQRHVATYRGAALDALRRRLDLPRGRAADVREAIVEALVGARLNSSAIRKL